MLVIEPEKILSIFGQRVRILVIIGLVTQILMKSDMAMVLKLSIRR